MNREGEAFSSRDISRSRDISCQQQRLEFVRLLASALGRWIISRERMLWRGVLTRHALCFDALVVATTVDEAPAEAMDTGLTAPLAALCRRSAPNAPKQARAHQQQQQQRVSDKSRR